MKKIVTLVLIIIWMVTIFFFSSQQARESSSLSEKITNSIIKVLKLNPKTQEQIDRIETIVRKLAHYCIYLIGGILILLHINLYEEKENKKVLLSQLIGSTYAITDEWHQLYVPGRSGEIRDVVIDSLGILTGIVIFLLIKNLKRKKE